MKQLDLKVSRSIPASAAEIYDAWLDTKHPGGPWFGTSRAIVNATVDGLFYHSVEHAGRTWAHYGRFVTLDKPRRIAHTWMSEATRGVETTVTVTLEAKGANDTEVTIHHSSVPDDEMGRGHEQGWKFVLAGLGERFAKAR